MTLFEKLNKPNYLFDSHCHINSYDFDVDRMQEVENAKDSKIEQIWDISVDILSSKKSLQLSKEVHSVKSFVGIDPEIFIPGSSLFEKEKHNSIQNLKDLLQENTENIFGIGETGMDYYWLGNSKLSEAEKEMSKKKQRTLFEAHLELAQQYDLPISIHSRGAEADCVDVAKNFKVDAIFHSFTGDYETARKILDNGWNLGVNGIITFKNAKELREIYSKILGKVSSPEEIYAKNVYMETDSPYLSPDGKRGQRNTPANIADIFKFLTENL